MKSPVCKYFSDDQNVKDINLSAFILRKYDKSGKKSVFFVSSVGGGGQSLGDMYPKKSIFQPLPC